MTTPYHARYFAHELTRQHAPGSEDRLSMALSYIPDIRHLDKPLLFDLYRWRFSADELAQAMAASGDIPTGLIGKVTLYQKPWFEGGSARLAGKSGWLAMKALHIQTKPMSLYLRCRLHLGVGVD